MLPQYPAEEAKRSYARVTAAVLSGFLIWQAVGSLLVVALTLIMPSFAENVFLQLVVSDAVLIAVALPLIYLIMKKVPSFRPVQGKMTGRDTFVSVMVALGLIWLFATITNWALIGVEKLFSVTLKSPVDELLGGDTIAVAIFTVVAAPLIEELVFRKFICDRLTRFGEKQAIVISGLLFSLYHATFQQFLYAFALGCFFAHIYIRTGKLRYTIMLHAIVNFFGSVPSMLIQASGISAEKVNDFIDGVIGIDELLSGDVSIALLVAGGLLTALATVAELVGVVIFFVYLRRMWRSSDGSYMPKQLRFRIMFANPAVWFFIVISVGLAIFMTVSGAVPAVS